MSNVKIYHDGWIALPATLRQQLSLAVGDELVVERVADGILLRVAKGAAAPIEEALPAPASAPAAIEPEMPVRRKPGRLKRATPSEAPEHTVLPPNLRSGGRRKPKGEDASQQDTLTLVTLG